jgi:hypothetical protein
MKQCRCQYTIKVTEGNEWDLLLQLKTDTYESDQPISGDIDFRALEDVVTTIDGIEWEHTIEDNGVMLHITAEEPEGWQGQPWRGPHNVELTATYFGVEIRAAYFECFTIVKWSYESNVRNFIPEAPLASELAFVYVGITDDDELERIKAELRQEVAAARAAKEQYEAMAEEYAEKIAELDDLATKTDVTTAQESIEGTLGTATATTTQNIATNEAHTAQNITAAKNEILAALPQEAPAEFIQSLFAHES